MTVTVELIAFKKGISGSEFLLENDLWLKQSA